MIYRFNLCIKYILWPKLEFSPEIILTFVYMLFAFLYDWFRLVNNDYRITSLNFRQWLIEASSAPILLFGASFSYYIRCIDVFFDEYQSFYISGFMVKVPLFFLIHYAESQSDLFSQCVGSVYFLYKM